MGEEQNEVLVKLNLISDRLDSLEGRISLLEKDSNGKVNEPIPQNELAMNSSNGEKLESHKKQNSILDRQISAGGCISMIAAIILVPMFLSSYTLRGLALPVLLILGYLVFKDLKSQGSFKTTQKIASYEPDRVEREVAIDSQKPKESFEVQLGQHFFSKLGIVALVIGIALFLIYSLQYFEAMGKVCLGYLSSLVLITFGYFLEKKYSRYGQLLLGGGVAVTYFTTYAAHFFPVTKIINNQTTALGLLTLISLSYLLYMLRYKSEIMAGIALLLVFLTANLGDIKSFSLVMLMIFLTVAVIISSVKKWKFNLLLSLVLNYLTVFRWIVDSSGYPIPIDQFTFILSIITISYSLFSLGVYFVYSSSEGVEAENEKESTEVIAFTIINSVIYYGFLAAIFDANYLEVNQPLMLSFSILNIVLAFLSRFFNMKKSSAKAYLGIATVSMFVYISLAFSDLNLVVGWLSLGMIYMIYGLILGTIRTRAVGMFIIVASFVALVISFWNIEETIFRLTLFGFAALFEILSLLFLNAKLKNSAGDSTLYDSYLQNILASSSVVSLALIPCYLESKEFLTLYWGIIAFVVAILGFVFNDKTFRRSGLILLLITVLRLFVVDLSSMDPILKIISFLVLGVILLAISFGYTKYKDEIRRYL